MLAAINLSSLLNEKLVEHASLSDIHARAGCLNQIKEIVLSRLNELTFKDLMNGSSTIPSLLWFLSRAPEAFLAVWQRFGQHIPLEALLAAPQEGAHKGISALWFLCKAASKNYNRPFLEVWERFGKFIPLDVLLEAQQDLGSRKCALELLCNPILLGWWKTLLQQKKGIISDDQLLKLNFPPPSNSFIVYAKPIVTERNHFFSLLNNKALQNLGDIQRLFTQAKKATDAGYANAFYDLGQFFYELGLTDKAFEAQKEVPNNSWHYSQTIIELCEHTFNLVLASLENPAVRIRHIQEALRFALLADDNNRPLLIQRIASIYIENKMNNSSVKLVPNEWLEAMNNNTPVDWCINRFDEIKKLRILEEKLKENEESLKEERAVKKHLLARMEMLENENQMLKKTKTEAALENQNPNTQTEEEKKATLFFSTQRMM